MAGTGQGASDARTSAKRTSGASASRGNGRGARRKSRGELPKPHGTKPHGKHDESHGKRKSHNKRQKHHHRKRRRHPATHKKALGTAGVALAIAPASPPAPSSAPVPALEVPLTAIGAHRLLWRAGFGPAQGQAQELAGQPLQQVVYSLTRPSGEAVLSGPAPHDEEGNPLDPIDVWGEDHCWWLDRMIRTDQPLVERMTYIWHDWFANSNAQVDSQKLMLEQNNLFRSMALGNFHELFLAVTANPAMLVFLDGIDNDKWEPNENYAREMMELFSLGADRGAYTQVDVHEMARTLTGWTAEWSEDIGLYNFHFDPSRHDETPKTVFGQTGNWNWEDAVRLCVEHPLHASFFVTKLWGYFIPTEPDEATLASLQGLYLGSGHDIRPVLEAILQHPDFYEGPELVTPPVVYNAGLLRAIGRFLDATGESGNPLQGLSLDYSLAPALATAKVPVAAVSSPAGYNMWAYGLGEPLMAPTLDAFGQLGELSAPSPAYAQARSASADTKLVLDQMAPFVGPEGKPTYTSPVTYPAAGGEFPQRLAALAAMLAAGLPIKCASLTAVGSFDTHSDESDTLSTNLGQSVEAVLAFQRDLEARGLDDRVLIQLWSEFGRRPRENGSGTDHGAGGVAFLIGTRAAGEMVGEFPGLGTLDENENTLNTSDFRSMYCSLLEQWFQTEAGLVIPEAASFARPTLIEA